GRAVVGGELRGRPVPDAGGDRAAEVLEVRRIVLESLRIGRRVGPAGRTLADGAEGDAIVLLPPRSELQVRPGSALHGEGAVELGPILPIHDVDILGAENPSEGYRGTAGERRGIVGAAEVEARTAADSMQGVAGSVAQIGLGLGDILRRRLALAPRRTDLPRERQGLAHGEIAVQI